MRAVLGALLLLSFGVGVGYAWRSYAPLAIPVESRLVSDALSSDLERVDQGEIARTANLRAERAEKEKRELQRQLNLIEAEHRRAEQELADLKIRAVLSNSN